MVSLFFFLFCLLKVLGVSTFGTCAILTFFYYGFNFFKKANEEIAIRPLILFLFSLNFLFSPAVMYAGLEKYQYYPMKLDETTYFMYAFPSVFLLQLGINSLSTQLFSPNPRILRMNASVYEEHLPIWIIGGMALSWFARYLPTDLAFLIYLLSAIRYVGAFSMLVLNNKNAKWYIPALFLYDLARSLSNGTFHDFLLWNFFAVLFCTYLFKPSVKIKITGSIIILIITFILQITKEEYRNRLTDEEVRLKNVGILVDAVNKTTNRNNLPLYAPENIAPALNRVNQAWIFASTIDNMERNKDFQGFSLLSVYLESALLPRIVAPNKLSAGDKALFSKYSGKKLADSTSMGLGIMADGFISFGMMGVFVFMYIFGFIFSLIFRVVAYWSNFCLLFCFFLFPLMVYPIRPDCATPTILGHIVKGLLVYQGFFIYYNWYNKEKSDYVKEIAFKRGLSAYI